MVKNLKVFETGMLYGNMNTAKAFYPEDYTASQRQQEFLMHRLACGINEGFDGRKMYMADQKHKRGTWFEIDRDYVEANPMGWTDIDQDILVITDKVPEVAIGHPVADCPVVMTHDVKHGILAIGHCSAELVDKKMPMLVVDALYNSYRSKDEDISVYVSACAGAGWTYDKYPAWAKDDKVWEEAITEENGIYHIDIRKAIAKQLKDRNISDSRIKISQIDTITDPRFYSNSAASPYGLNMPEKAGRNFAGAFFKDVEDAPKQNIKR